MTNCAVLEPAPTRFYAPANLFSNEDLKQLGAEWLGEWIVSPGYSFRYCVATGPYADCITGMGSHSRIALSLHIGRMNADGVTKCTLISFPIS